jgi:hypothetical protein
MIPVKTQKHQLETSQVLQNLEVKQTLHYFKIQLVISCPAVISCLAITP